MALPVWGVPIVTAAEEPAPRFLFTDYSRLGPVSEERPSDLHYIAPGAMEEVASHRSVFIEQPEVFLQPESPYKGLKPDHMKILADAYAEFVAEALEGSGE